MLNEEIVLAAQQSNSMLISYARPYLAPASTLAEMMRFADLEIRPAVQRYLVESKQGEQKQADTTVSNRTQSPPINAVSSSSVQRPVDRLRASCATPRTRVVCWKTKPLAGRRPRRQETERVKGIEPSFAAWEASSTTFCTPCSLIG